MAYKQYNTSRINLIMFVFVNLFLFALKLNAQYVGINATGSLPDSSSGLDIDFANKGLLIPRVALTGALDVTTISSPTISLLIYNTATAGVLPNNVVPGYYYYNGTQWIQFLSNGGSGGIWSRISPTVFLTDNSDFVGIGTQAPQYKLDIIHNTNMLDDRAVNILFNTNATSLTGDSSAALLIKATGTSSGSVNSGYFNTTGNSTGNCAGLLNFVNGSGSGSKIGVGQMISGNGDKAGISANVSGTGNIHYGTYLDISGATTNFGIYAKTQGGLSSYGLYIDGNPKYSAYLKGDVFYVAGIASIGYNSGFYNSAYTLDINGKSNFTNAIFINNSAGLAGYVLKSNGPTTAPKWVSADSVGYWSDDGYGNIYNSNLSGSVDASGPDFADFTNPLTYLLRVKSVEPNNGLSLQFGIKTDIVATNRYGAIEVDDNGTKRNLILQPISGNVGIGCSSPTAKLHVNGTIRSTVAITTTALACSDRRYKKLITPLTNSLIQIQQMNGVYYFWKKDEFKNMGFTDDKQIGFIAQEVEKIYPELVNTDEQGYKSVDYSKVTPIIVEAIKEQQKQIEELKTIVTEQQKQINQLLKH